MHSIEHQPSLGEGQLSVYYIVTYVTSRGPPDPATTSNHAVGDADVDLDCYSRSGTTISLRCLSSAYDELNLTRLGGRFGIFPQSTMINDINYKTWLNAS
jgi:hypothetical protein